MNENPDRINVSLSKKTSEDYGKLAVSASYSYSSDVQPDETLEEAKQRVIVEALETTQALFALVEEELK